MIFRLSQKLKAKIKAGALDAVPLDDTPYADWSTHLSRQAAIVFATVKLLHTLPIARLP